MKITNKIKGKYVQDISTVKIEENVGKYDKYVISYEGQQAIGDGDKACVVLRVYLPCEKEEFTGPLSCDTSKRRYLHQDISFQSRVRPFGRSLLTCLPYEGEDKSTSDYLLFAKKSVFTDSVKSAMIELDKEARAEIGKIYTAIADREIARKTALIA